MSRWADLLRLAATRFALPPEAFWRLSLVEWRALTAAPVASVPPRAELEALMARFPDLEDA